MTQIHINRNLHQARRKEGRTDGGKEGGEFRCSFFLFFVFLDLREAGVFCDGWIPGIPELISQFRENKNGAAGAPSGLVDAPPQAP